jgi:hypothetical protein
MCLSNHLENLIHAGKAEFKVFSAGGGEKSILNIQQNHFIIITNVLFQPQFTGDTMNQLNIVSEAKINSLIFRNTLSSVGGVPTPGNYNCAISVDTYFMHKTSVQFCFSRIDAMGVGTNGTFNKDSFGFNPNIDYGKDTIAGSQVVLKRRANSLGQEVSFEGNTVKALALVDYFGLNFPMIGLSLDAKPQDIPLCTISYVEVFSNNNPER